MPILKGLFSSAVLLVLGSCYTFRPTAIEGIPAGSVMRAHLTPAGAEEASTLTGEARARIEGSVVRTSPDTVVLEVWRTDLRLDRNFTPGRLQVPLQTRYIVDVAEKRLSIARTGAVAVVLGLGVYQVYRLLTDGAGGTSTGDPRTGGPSIIRCC